MSSGLPVALTSFIGREEALVELAELLARVRLLTIAGTGGSGKTRLAVELARRAEADYPDGTWFADLVPVQDSQQLTERVVEAIGLEPQASTQFRDALAGAVGSGRCLLVLDNCEHVIDAAASLVEVLLRACPSLRILATTREPLRCEGETVWRVPPLSLPNSRGDGEALALFTERARAALPSFTVTPENLPAVSEICRQLEGMPLAIELAAARVATMSPAEIVERLRRGGGLPGRGVRAAPARQQTIGASMQWSYDLLDDVERDVFCRLSVFRGGWQMEAAVGICASIVPPEVVEEVLLGLVDKSLVVAERGNGPTRYRLLEPVRQFAAAKLGEDEIRSARALHTDWFLAEAERRYELMEGYRPPEGGELIEALAWCDRELDNLRAALEWAISEAPSPETGLRLVAALGSNGFLRGHFREGADWARQALDRARGSLPTASRARAMRAGSRSHFLLDETAETIALLRESAPLSVATDEPREAFATLVELSWRIARSGDLEEAQAALEAADQLLPDPEPQFAWRRYRVLEPLSLRRGDMPGYLAAMEEGLRLCRLARDGRWISYFANSLGEYYRGAGEYEKALACYQEAAGERPEVRAPIVLANMGLVAIDLGDLDRAARYLAEVLARGIEFGVPRVIRFSLFAIAALATSLGHNEEAAVLLGYVRATMSEELEAADAPVADGIERSARRKLGAVRFAELLREGASLELRVAAQRGERLLTLARSQSGDAGPAAAGLTAREIEVLRLLASGHSSREMAEELVVSVRTIDNHIANIYAKIGARGRADATAFAIRHGIAVSGSPERSF